VSPGFFKLFGTIQNCHSEMWNATRMELMEINAYQEIAAPKIFISDAALDV
jgi:hypothetical protein